MFIRILDNHCKLLGEELCSDMENTRKAVW